MEELFTNSYRRDKRVFKEMFNYEFFGRPGMKFCFVLMLLGVFFFAMGAITTGYFADFVFAALFVTFFFLIIKCSANTKTKVMTNVDKETTYGKGMTIDTAFYEHHMEVKTSNSECVIVKYYLIKKVKVLKNTTLIITKANIMYAIKNNCFTKGQLYECLQFLKSKDIKVK